MKSQRSFRSPDGVHWVVDVDLAGSSNAIVTFRHPQGATARLDRYNWYLSNGPEARNVTSHLSPSAVLNSIDDAAMTRLFQRSMNISRPDPLLPSLDASNG
ncbi:MAG: hypothetical protein ABI442_18735 [Gemmatimonadaceae bacterium]